MEQKLELRYGDTPQDFERFMELRDEYMRRDILPCCTLGKPISEEEKKWFFSDEYREHLRKLYDRTPDRLRIVFFMAGGQLVGFCNYVTYFTEDSKCFIIDYCIEPEHRGRGLGRAFWWLLSDSARADGAAYFALNLSNEDNLRFWRSNGFEPSAMDEYGEMIYVLR